MPALSKRTRACRPGREARFRSRVVATTKAPPRVGETGTSRDSISYRIGMARKEPSMLVLSRQRDETIMIGDDVEITVVDIRGDKVRLGITAPRRIQVHRKEVYDAIKRENERAARLNPSDVSDVVETDTPPSPLPEKKANDNGQTENQHRSR